MNTTMNLQYNLILAVSKKSKEVLAVLCDVFDGDISVSQKYVKPSDIGPYVRPCMFDADDNEVLGRYQTYLFPPSNAAYEWKHKAAAQVLEISSKPFVLEHRTVSISI